MPKRTEEKQDKFKNTSRANNFDERVIEILKSDEGQTVSIWEAKGKIEAESSLLVSFNTFRHSAIY